MPDGETTILGEFSARLHSGDMDVVTDALRDYQQAQADTRWGVDNPYRPLDNEVLFVARDILDRPPAPAPAPAADDEDEDEDRADPVPWALTMLWHLGEDEDAERIAAVLERATDPGLREDALSAASTALADGEEPNPRLLAAVSAVALDETLDARDRERAISALGDVDTPEAEALIVGLTESADISVQVSAALQLSSPRKVRAHRARLRRLVDSWPPDASPWAGHVRDALTGFHSTYWKDANLDDPDLRAAHDELMFPLNDETCLEAFATLLRSDDPVAIGIALDHYESWEGLRKTLDDGDLAEARLPEVLERAREVLRRRISPAEVSALNMIAAQHAEASDAALVVDVLSRTDSDTVRHEALWVALGVFGKSETPDAGLVEAAGGVLFDPSAGRHAKETAVRILADGLGAAADEFLLRALREEEPKVQAHAAFYLVRTGALDRHRPVLEAAADAWEGRSAHRPWGEDPAEMIFGKPHSVHWAGHRLPDPDLRQAHRRLRRREMDDSYHQAMRTLLNSGDEAAVGIALDHWWDADGAVARGGEAAREPARDLVLTRVGEILRGPASRPELSREYGPTANHLTALSALKVAAPDDLTILADALDNPDAPHLNVLLDASEALQTTGRTQPRLAQALERFVQNADADDGDQALARQLLEELSPGSGRSR
ncbi:hypothetical protein [Actinomadura rupiterrae]|uniref:hypothetical protein n=1 Tax=Actinomadura rupiterrae TaxID=559627 RepID=UPI0020A4E827|nr:hypothetical protein [Actinomadura rupiterrae]MCP2341607.1 hypothetical protein [Actinomadura rupiterrae]